MEYLTLIEAEETTIAEPEREFLNLHREIMYCGNAAATYAVEMAKKLKQMRGGKLYRAAEFDTFGAYVENAVGIKERQAYNYISVLENLPESFLQSNAKLGVTKLALLAPLSEQERKDVIESADVESATVKQLQAEIAAMQKKTEQMQIDFDFKEAAFAEATADAQQAVKDKEAEIAALKADKDAFAETSKKLAAIEVEKTKLQKEIQQMKETPAEVKTVDNPETAAALTAAQEREKALALEVETLKKQLVIASDESMSKFKIKFEDLQRLGAEMLTLLQSIEPEKATKCRNGIKSIIAGWNL